MSWSKPATNDSAAWACSSSTASFRGRRWSNSRRKSPSRRRTPSSTPRRCIRRPRRDRRLGRPAETRLCCVAAGVRCRGRGAPSLRLLEQVEKPMKITHVLPFLAAWLAAHPAAAVDYPPCRAARRLLGGRGDGENERSPSVDSPMGVVPTACRQAADQLAIGGRMLLFALAQTPSPGGSSPYPV